jgi:hypothetical protein
MMRRLLVALLVLLTPLLVVPAIAAQEATPEAAEMAGTSDVARTDTRFVVPFTEDGLNPGLNVTSTEEGACTFSSSVANGRPDAWGCTTDGGVLDPCFESSFVAMDEATEVACLSTPWSTDVVMLSLTAPLMREKEGPGGAPSGPADTADEVIQPWDLPWALELANGDRCSLMHGTLIAMAGQVSHYGCENGGMVLGETDRSQPVWTVTYLAEGDVASNQVDVAVAWS